MSSNLEQTPNVLAQPPFVVVPGVINIRGIGGYPTLHPNLFVKPSFLFRSGELTRITDDGKNQLRALGITKVFDLRSKTEIVSYDSLTPSIEGVELVWAPVSQKEAYDPASLAARLQDFEKNELESFVDMYTEILESGGQAFETIFTHLRDEPEKPCLVHCTAGKDRTGIFTALTLMLLGVDDKEIVEEYALTTLGLEPALPLLIARFQAKQAYRENWQGTLKMSSANADNMTATLQMIRRKYGGAEGYLMAHTNLKDDDMKKIRQNLLVRGPK